MKNDNQRKYRIFCVYVAIILSHAIPALMFFGIHAFVGNQVQPIIITLLFEFFIIILTPLIIIDIIEDTDK